LLCDLELMCNEIPKMKKKGNLKLKPHLVWNIREQMTNNS
jgi:hypothetical protein